MSKKQFTLDSWLKDKSQKVVTRCGFPVRIVCTDVKRKDYPILALVERDDQEEYQSFTKDGRFSLYNPLHDNFDLFIETADEVCEDEKVRKALLEMVHDTTGDELLVDYNVHKEEALAWLEKQGEKRPDPYNGISFEYNGHTWGMCARDNGVDILLDKQLFKHLEKQDEQKETNLVEILKHYPKETELYSPLYGKLWLAEVDEKNEIITCYKHHLEEGCTRAVLEQEDTVSFYSNGTTGLPDFNISKDCMLFLYDIEKQGEQEKDMLEDAILDGYILDDDEDGLIAATIEYSKKKPKFKIGDFIANDYCFGKVIALTDDAYLLDTEQGIPFSCEHNVHLWTIDDAKDGDVLYINNTVSESIIIYKSFNNKLIKKYASYNKFGFEGEHYLTLNDGYIVPATKEQCDLLFRKMKEAGYEWDAEKKELKKINSYCQENCKGFQETGKCFADEECKAKREAEQELTNLEEFINELSKQFPDVSFAKLSRIVVRVAKWAKSDSRVQSQWKPSDKQMNVLWCHCSEGSILKSLYDDLKKLKES